MKQLKVQFTMLLVFLVMPLISMKDANLSADPLLPIPVSPPTFQAFPMDHYDDLTFRIAEVLAERKLGSSQQELLDLGQLILEKSVEIDVPPSLLLALIDVESTFNPCARSGKGAKGLMQVMPNRILGVEEVADQFAFSQHLFYDPHWNIQFGADYLGYLIERFGDLDVALAAYNQGPTRVASKLRRRTFRGSRYARRVLAKEKIYTSRM
ncbi:Lytic transglycosylase domain-containing protein [Sulfidibacter corallicola]|uniref:Lytic transglycosylase domain-containing protein n=1 Tax=Sulfidibacter corallicola TaxID=2818388 RepID=A0A8A4TPU2_SULCO|nr:lytic transglycosylase domain-containing protein [Sulfidibacter corallicola]QTD51989.1 lytic transglycosylase domain-containing protein [Sulfidibacter corallicola]